MGRLVELGDRRVLHPGRLRWLRALGWMALNFVVAALVMTIVYAAVILIAYATIGGFDPHRPATAPAAVKLIGNILGPLAVLGYYTLVVRFGENRMPSELALGRAVPELAMGLAIGAAMMLLTGFVLWATGWAHYEWAHVTKIANAVGEAIESGVVEETIFRLIVLRLVWRASNAWVALAVSALLFGGLHLANPNASWFAAICIAFEAGIMLAAFYILTGRLWISIGLHAGWNFTQGWVLGSPVSGTAGFAGGPVAMHPTAGVPEWMSGGGFGPEASISALLVCTAVGVWVLWIAYRRGRMDGPAATGQERVFG